MLTVPDHAPQGNETPPEDTGWTTPAHDALDQLSQAAEQPSPEVFLSFFPGSFTQYFDDTEAKDKRKALSSPHFERSVAEDKQRDNCGVFQSLNAFKDKRQKNCLTHIQALFVDIDLGKEGDGTSAGEMEARKLMACHALTAFALKPHCTIETKNGLQAVWLMRPAAGKDAIALFEEGEDILIRHFNADDGAKDVTRVLRLPGFDHLKTPATPFRIRLLLNELARAPYNLEEAVGVLRAIDVFSEEPTGAPAAAPQKKQRGKRKWQTGLEGVGKGERNSTAASVIGKLVKDNEEELWETAVWGGAKEWNSRNPEPLGEEELRSVYDSVTKKAAEDRAAKEKEAETKGGGNPMLSQSEILLSLITEQNCQPFHDQFKEPYARILVKDHWEICKLRGRQSKRWLGRLLWEATKEGATSETISTVLNVLEARALFEGEQVKVFNRIAQHGDAILYDLGNPTWQAVRIDQEGWKLMEHPPLVFRRFSHQEEQAMPERGGSLEEIFRFIKLKDGKLKVLFLCYLVSCFIPDIPHPIPNLHGPQGSAKTSTARLLRMLIDPSQMATLSFSSGTEELVQQLSHHYYAFFDNISQITDAQSDFLCRAVTGEGYSKRELYSDDDDIIYSFRRCIGLNGINVPARKPDLLDRSILVRLERIPKAERREEKEIQAAFKEARPKLLGAIFDALSKAMGVYETVILDELPRMADFTRWGCAIAVALGYSKEEFLAEYKTNISEQHGEAIQESPVACAVRAFMATQTDDKWTGTMTELLAELLPIAEQEKLDIRSKEWPKAPQALSRRLNEAKTNLAEVGIVSEHHAGKHGERLITFQSIEPSTVNTVVSSGASAESQEQQDDIYVGMRVDIPSEEAPADGAQLQAPDDGTDDTDDASSNTNALKGMGFFQ